MARGWRDIGPYLARAPFCIARAFMGSLRVYASHPSLLVQHVVVVVVVFTLKAVPISTQYFLTSVLVQLTRTPAVVTG